MDFNEDGKMDLISGEYDGTVHAFINVGTASDPILTYMGRIQVDGSDLSAGYYSDPAIMDWNQDGLFDLLVGGGDGLLRLFINDGSPGAPHFSAMEYVQDGGSNLLVDMDAGPDVADLDGDGLEDLILGEYEGTIRFYRNQGVQGDPYFSGYTLLTYSGEHIDLPYYSRPCVIDWDNDGGPDLVVGQYLSSPILYLNDPQKVLIANLTVNYTGPWYLPRTGGDISFDVTVSNPNNQPITFDFYVCSQNAPVGFWGPVINYQGITLDPGRTITRSFIQFVPGGAPDGIYDCAVYIGNSPEWQFIQMALFTFYKM